MDRRLGRHGLVDRVSVEAWTGDVEAGRGVGLGRLGLLTLRPAKTLSTE